MIAKTALLLLASMLTSFMGFGQCFSFYEGFESGAFSSPWTIGSGSYTVTIPSTSPAVGTYNLSLASSTTGEFYEGVYATFPTNQPSYVSWYMRTNTTNNANGYFVLGDDNIGSNNGILFAYFNSNSELRFFASSGYNYSITANTWYHIEVKNIDWTTRTMDIYINNSLLISGWPMRSTTSTGVTQLHLFNLNSATAEYDDIFIGHTPILSTSSSTDLGCYNDSTGTAGVIASGGNGNYSYLWSPNGDTTANLSNLAAGTYTCTITDGNGCTDTQTVIVSEPPQISSIVDTSICAGEIWVVGSSTYYSTGNYTDILTANNGCDSTVYTNLTVADSIDISTTLIMDTINANATGASFQWVNCDSSYSIISGETASSFVPSVSGNYAVIVTIGACSDTSDCVNVVISSLQNYHWVDNIKIHPNPTLGVVRVSGIEGPSILSVYNSIGVLIFEKHVNLGDCDIDLSSTEKGVYLIRIVSNTSLKTLQVIKE